MATIPFFVYGSLSQGMVHFEKIQNFIENSINAKTLGSVYRLQVGFPVFLKQGSDVVCGQFVELKQNDLLISLLDQFYGFNPQDEKKCLHFRQTIYVELESGDVVEAWAYVLNPEMLPKNAELISGGDWQEAIKEKPSLVEKLTEKQRNYILRLGKTTGREIVPIDLALYRELMNLEIIVDKGRRLALSKLGHEVYRYLT